MFAKFVFTDKNQFVYLKDTNRIGVGNNFAQLSAVNFPPIAPISQDLQTNTFNTSLGDVVLGMSVMPNDLGDMVDYLNTVNTNFTWTYSRGILSVENANAFSIKDTRFSRLILGCDDFTTEQIKHTFLAPALFPFHSYMIAQNSLLGAREMSDTALNFLNFPINGDEYLNGMAIRLDSASLVNQSPIKFSRESIADGVEIPYGVVLNDGSNVIISPSVTRPFIITIFYTNETGFEL